MTASIPAGAAAGDRVMYDREHAILAQLFSDSKNMDFLREKAKQGVADAQFCLGVAYQYGHGVKQDEEEAVRWYAKAAEQGLLNAIQHMAYAYRTGHGVSRDDKEAMKWYRLAAEQGDAEGQYYLGIGYASGHGVEKDAEQAKDWLWKAVQQGYQAAVDAFDFLTQNQEKPNE